MAPRLRHGKLGVQQARQQRLAGPGAQLGSLTRQLRGITRLVLILLLTLDAGAALARNLIFGVVAKSVDDPNFVTVWRSCNDEAKRNGDSCELIGNSGAANARLQAQALDAAVKSRRFAAFAVSVTSSDVLANVVRRIEVPVITFDSPFDTHTSHLSRAYIGVDNIAFGRDLARAAKKLRPQGGTLCLMTAATDTNLSQRLWGIRLELSGNAQLPDGKRLNGHHGWYEPERCPWNTADQIDRAQRELEITFERIKPDVFISVGHWPILDTPAYLNTVEPFRSQITAKQPVMIVAVGSIAPAHADLMKQGLVHAYVSIDFESMGRSCYRIMRAAANGLPVASVHQDTSFIRLGK